MCCVVIQPFLCVHVHVDDVAIGHSDDPADGCTGSLTGGNDDSDESFP